MRFIARLFGNPIDEAVSSLESETLDKKEEIEEVALVGEQVEQEGKKGSAVVEILEEHDRAYQSPISKLARWVGELSWYKHLLLLAVVVAIAAIVGAFLQAVLICTIAVGILYIALAGLLKYHHYCEERRVKTNTEMAAYAEEKLHEGIEDVKEVGHDLDRLSSGLDDASRTMEGFGQEFATQNKKQGEQILATEALNLRINYTHTALEESRQTLDKTHGEIETVYTRLADNMSHLSEVEQSFTTSSLTIEQAASVSKKASERLAQNVTALDAMVGTLKDNASTGVLLLDQVRQSTIELADTMKETAKSRERLTVTLEQSSKLIQSSKDLIEGFAENRQQTEDSQRQYEEAMEKMEAIDSAFQDALASLTLPNENPTYIQSPRMGG